MKSEFNNPAPDTNYPHDDYSIGNDTLWQENSGELGVKPPRVAYSNHPASTLGIVATAPPIIAETSLFRWIEPQDDSIDRIALREGLRAVNLFATDTPDTVREAQAEEVARQPIITELALQGLQWLIPQVKRGDPLRRDATRARAHLEPVLTAQTETRLQQARLEALNQAAELAVTAEDLHHDKLQVGYQDELQAAINSHAETSPKSYDYTAFRTLSECLTLDESDGGLAVKEKLRYQRKLNSIINGYLEEPDQFYEGMQAAAAIAVFAGESLTPEALESSPAFLFANHVIGSLAAETANRSYSAQDLTHETINKWFQFAASMSKPVETMKRFSERDGIYIDMSRGDEELAALALVTGERIIAQSLQKIATTQPRSLIDSLYQVADTGLDPSHSMKRAATLATMQRALSNEPTVGVILAYSVGANGHPAIQKKALDLQLTLVALGMPSHLMYPETTIDKDGVLVMQANDRQASRILRGLYPSVLCPNQSSAVPGDVFKCQLHDWYDHWRQEFLEFAGTPEGRISTLFGRHFNPKSFTYEELSYSMAESDLSLQHLLPKRSHPVL